MYEDIGKALGTDYFHIRDELSEMEVDYLERARRLRRGRGAAGDRRLLGASRASVGADEAAR